MELLGVICILGLITFLIIGLYLPSLFAVEEEDIGNNIRALKKHAWFQTLLNNQNYKQLIIHEKDVRNTIGTFNSSRLNNKHFENKYRKKLQNILAHKPSSLA